MATEEGEVNTTGDIDTALDNLQRLKDCPENLSPRDVEDKLPNDAWLDHEDTLWVDTRDTAAMDNQKSSLTKRRQEILELCAEHGGPGQAAQSTQLSHQYTSQVFETFSFILDDQDLQEAFLEGRWDTSKIGRDESRWEVNGTHVEDVSIYSDTFTREQWAEIVRLLHKRGGSENEEKAERIMLRIL